MGRILVRSQPLDPYLPSAMCPTAILRFLHIWCGGFNSGTKLSAKIGCSSIGFSISGEICFAAQLFWPEKLVANPEFGSNTTFLEMIGLILPFLLIPETLRKKHVILRVDNIGCYYAWQNKYVKNDISASIITRALVLISAFLECQVHVEHLPRMSTWDACACDRMSRDSSTQPNDRALLRSFGNLECPEHLTEWLSSGCDQWNLATELLSIVENKCLNSWRKNYFGELFWVSFCFPVPSWTLSL